MPSEGDEFWAGKCVGLSSEQIHLDILSKNKRLEPADGDKFSGPTRGRMSLRHKGINALKMSPPYLRVSSTRLNSTDVCVSESTNRGADRMTPNTAPSWLLICLLVVIQIRYYRCPSELY